MKDNDNSNTDTCCDVTSAEKRGTDSHTTREQTWVRPFYEVDRNEEAFRLRVYVPGANKSGVELKVDNGILNLVASRGDTPEDGWRPLSREIVRGDYRLEVRVPEKVDVDSITAAVNDGVLVLTMPLREAAKPRVIAVD